tara:strand:- start:1117 stop:1332 length:216 start_codon:yes stop_codon:yes gene_type:complete
MSTPNKVEVSQVSDVTTVEITTVGPQGPGFDLTLEHSDKVNDSIMYYDQSSNKVKLDSTTTKLKLVDGGNF